MAERDPLDGLRDLARAGEDFAHPMPADDVRRLGDQRRTRRHTSIVATAVLAVVVAGGAILSQGILRTDQTPNPAEPTPTLSATPTPAPTATPTPTRTVSEANLIRPNDLPRLDQERFVTTPARAGRPADQITVCLPKDGMAQFAPTSSANRNFRMDRRADGSVNEPDEPFGNNPTIYTQVLQFGSRSEAKDGYATFRSWLAECRKHARANGKVQTSDGEWIPVHVNTKGAQAGFDEAQWRDADSTDANAGYFESVGLVLLDDRLAVTVEVVFGQDYNVSYLPSGDAETGLPPHPQFVLVEAAARRMD